MATALGPGAGRRPGHRRQHRRSRYTELEAAGLIVSRRRTGTVVTTGSATPMPAEVLADAARLARSAASARLTAEQAVDLLHSAMFSAG